MKKTLAAILFIGALLAAAAFAQETTPAPATSTAPAALTAPAAAPESASATTPAAPAVNSQEAAISAEENVPIKKIEITGAFEVPEDTIRAAIESKVGDPINTQKLEEDLQRVFDLGFFSEDVKVNLSEFEGGAKVTFKVVENPVVGKINITGNKAITTAELTNLIQTKENKVLNKGQLKKDIDAIEKLYKDRGFIVARVADMDMDPTTKNLNISITEGVIQSIEVIYVTRNKDDESVSEKKSTGKTKPRVVLREMKTKPGDTLNAEKIKKDLQRVFNLGLFNDVSWEINTDPARVELGKIILQVQIEEAKTGQVGFGAGYSNSTGLTGFLSYSEQNLSGMGRRISTQVERGSKRADYTIGYFEPWIDKKNTSLELNVYDSSQQNFQFGLGGTATTDYQEIHKGFNVTGGRPITDNTRAYVGLKAESVNVTPDQYSYLNGSVRNVNFSLRTDTRDNIFFPLRGRFDTGYYEIDGKWLGGDFNYQKAHIDIRRFHPVRRKQTIGAHAFIGISKDQVPVFDYYDIGGVNTVRGYDELQFSGSKAAYFNGEYRMQLGGNVSGVLFADAGAVWSRFSDMSLKPHDYVKSIGAGIRLQIPQLGGFGPIRLDYAYAISIKNSKIHFGFGQMF